MSTNIQDGDRHLRPSAYYSLALLAGVIGLSASYVTVELFALAIRVTEPEGTARELLTMAAALFVIAELAAFFIAGLIPVRRLRALRWQLTACAVLLVAFEAVSIYGARVALVHTADARADAGAGRAEQLRASIEANRRSAAALLSAGQRSSQSAIASSRADGARSLRDAAAMEADTRRMVAELAQLRAARTPTATAVFGEAGVIALAVAQSLLISCIGLLFLGTAGALARAARDARGAAVQTVDAPAAATPAPASAAVAASVQKPAHVGVEQAQATPHGAAAAVPSWRRYALPAGALAAGAGLAAMVPAHAQAAQPQARAAAAPPAEPLHDDSTALADASTTIHPSALTPMQPADDTAPMAAATDADALPTDAAESPTRKTRRAAAPRAASVRDTGVGEDDGARFQRVKEGIEAGRIRPSIRAIYTAAGASQEVARRYLVELEQAGVIEPAGRGRGYRLRHA